MRTFFTSDHHFGHANIIKYANRPFSNVNDMDKEMIRAWNSVVHYDDLVYHVGDFCFADANPYVHALNGKIMYIRGNHDKQIINWMRMNRQSKVIDCHELHQFDVDGQGFVACHFAMRVWNKSHFGTWHVYGHSHNSLPDLIDSLSMDVGVDSAHALIGEYRPFSFEEVKQHMSKKTFVPIDHHKGNQ